MNQLKRSAMAVMLAGVLVQPVAVWAADEEDDVSAAESVAVSQSDDPNAPGYEPAYEKAAEKPVPKAEMPVIKVERAAPTPKPEPVAEPKPAEKPVAVPAPVAKAKPAEPAPRDIPMIETQNDVTSSPEVTYVTGGVGDEEREAIEASKGDYNLHITNASTSGEFVGDARVVISRHGANGGTEQMLNIVAGPLLNVKLPSGTYRVTATLGQQVKRQAVAVKKKGAPVVVHLGWK